MKHHIAADGGGRVAETTDRCFIQEIQCLISHCHGSENALF